MAKKPQDNNLFGELPKAAKPETKAPAKSRGEERYTAAAIEVLEGLEPVRRRPGMYIGGTDEKALHHLFAEVLDNCMDEAVAGHASWIDVAYTADGYLAVTDNGRGMPVDPHPKFKDKSALEVIMTVLHAGGKFDSDVYETSGGLHGVGVSVVNALSEHVIVEVARRQQLYAQEFQPRTTGNNVVRFRVPTALERAGDFSQTPDNNGNLFPYIKDPLGTGKCSATSRPPSSPADAGPGRTQATRHTGRL
mgnify:CR=1 FL=1